MLSSIRPYATAGVALVGAGVIAVAPTVTPPLPDIKVPATVASPVQLTVSPIEFYTGLFERTTGNASALVEKFLANPAPILSQIIENQVANLEFAMEVIPTSINDAIEVFNTVGRAQLEIAFQQLAEGDLYGAVQTVQNIMLPVALPLLEALGAPLRPIMMASDNLNRVVQQVIPSLILAGPIALIGPINATMAAAVYVVQSIADGVMSGDPIEVVNALINAPGVVIDGFLNGGYGGVLNGGILSVAGMGPPGPIDLLLTFREQIAQALVPQGPYAPTTSAASAVEESAPPTAQVTKTTLGNNVVDVEVSATSLDTTTSSAAGPEGNSTPVAKTGNDGAGSENPVEQVESEGLSDTGLSDDDSTTALKNDESTTPSGGTDLSNGNKVSPTATTAATTQNGVAKNRGLTKASLGDATGGSSGGDSGSATGSSRTTAGSGNTVGSDSGDE